jgi:predicted TIM-barrel fold metal-dependent hydrolase
VEIVNCHVHTFTEAHTPSRYLPWPVPELARIPGIRNLFIWLARLLDPDRKSTLGRYAQILETSYKKTQGMIFDIVRGFYPEGTRFVVLPMDMTHMNAGRVRVDIDAQHQELAALKARYRDAIVPFAAVDPRHDDVLEKTVSLVEHDGFRGLKLYPPTGYHPFDRRLWPLYEYAVAQNLPVMTHCSRPEHVQYRGRPTKEMLTDPVTGDVLALGRYELLERFTDPEAYVPLLEKHRDLRVCLAHFGGHHDWTRYLDKPWHSESGQEKSWLAKILDLIRSGDYPGLWTDISYTTYAKEEHVYLLKVLLSDPKVARRVLFGSDFYVVENAELEERRRSVRIRAVLGEDLFDEIARKNPREFLGEVPVTP